MTKTVIVSGDMILKDGKDTYLEDFEETFTISDVETESEARCLIKNAFIVDRLKEKTPLFRSVHTMRIDSMEASKERKPEDELETAMLEATRLGCIPENIANYRRKDFKFTALKRAISAKKAQIEKDRKEKELKDAR